MATNFPTSLDAYSNPAPTDDVSVVVHSTQHANHNDAIEALEAKVGINGSADTTSLDYKLKSTSSSDPGHKHTLANGATDVTATVTELNYVDGVTSAIQTQLDGKVNDTGDETIAGIKTFSSDPIIPDEAYGTGWNGSLEPPTKNAVYDKIETLGSGTANYNTWSTIFESVSSRYTLTQGSSGTVTATTNGIRLNTNSGNTAICKLMLRHDTTSGNQNIFDGSSSFSTHLTAMNSSAGTGYQWLGLSQDSSNMLHTDTTKGYWFVKEIIAGTSTLWAVNANGTSVTATDISSGVTLTNGHTFHAVKNGTTDIKFYVDGTLKATHTTNIPSGQTNSNDFFCYYNTNGSGDSTARIMDVSNLTIQYTI